MATAEHPEVLRLRTLLADAQRGAAAAAERHATEVASLRSSQSAVASELATVRAAVVTDTQKALDEARAEAGKALATRMEELANDRVLRARQDLEKKMVG